jgi:predicted Zn-dependent peptidase
MTLLDRHIAPASHPVSNISMLPVEHLFLSNGVEVMLLKSGSQDLVKIDFVFQAGLVQAGKPLLASTVNNLLAEGTLHHTSAELSEKLDFYGAFTGQQASYHHSVVTLYSLSKHLPHTLPLMAEIMQEPTFPQHEIDIYIDKKKQEYLLESEKVKTLAARQFSKIIFGDNHPYGMVATLELYDSIQRQELIDFHERYYKPLQCKIIIAGQPGDQLLPLLESYFGQNAPQPQSSVDQSFPNITPSNNHYHHIPKDGALQAAIRVGRPLFNRTHPDYAGVQVLNTILGGYFGSRLMRTIREEKGYTYGISSYTLPLKHHGFWNISTEVRNEVRQETIDLIHLEMNNLRNNAVEEEELDLVKNYMLGELIRSFDGPFATSDSLRNLIDNDLDFSYFSQMTEEIRTITPERIQTLAQLYLNPNDFYTIVAG